VLLRVLLEYYSAWGNIGLMVGARTSFPPPSCRRKNPEFIPEFPIGPFLPRLAAQHALLYCLSLLLLLVFVIFGEQHILSAQHYGRKSCYHNQRRGAYNKNVVPLCIMVERAAGAV
jgi:hypothetical protein